MCVGFVWCVWIMMCICVCLVYCDVVLMFEMMDCWMMGLLCCGLFV